MIATVRLLRLSLGRPATESAKDAATGVRNPVLQIDKDELLVRVRNMSKVTSKLQVTIPKVLADRFGIHPGDELEWVEAGEAIRVELASRSNLSEASIGERLKWYDQATRRQQERELVRPKAVTDGDRGWTREELYDRGGVG